MSENDSSSPPRSPAEVSDKLEQALFEIRRIIAGQDAMLERVLVCLLSQGHLLIEGVPGLAKTLTIKTTASVLGGSFARVQFTPDLVPADLVGTRIYRPDKGEFDTELGPVFCNFLLADEINRAPAKVQSALLEVMQERQVTLAHTTYPVPEPVPRARDAEPDRVGGHLSAARGPGRPLHAQDPDRLPRARRGADDRAAPADRAPGAARGAEPRRAARPAGRGGEDLRRPGARLLCGDARVGDARPGRVGLADLGGYVEYGASPRGPISLTQSARAIALLRGRDYATAEDVRALAKDALRHRLVLSYQALAENVSADEILDRVLAAVPAPEVSRARPPAVA